MNPELLNKIHQGDCLEFMKQLPDKCIDLVVTDPPYGIDIGSMNFTKSITGGVAKRNDYTGMADWDKYTPDKECFDEILRISKNQVIFGGNYFTDKLPVGGQWIIWDKRVEEKYSNDFADCELAWTSGTKPTRIIRYLWSGMMQGNMKNKEVRHHPTQKPVEVMSKIIAIFDGDIIFDPFAGSGTTLVAAKQLGRKFLGCELSEKYVAIANERLRQDYLF
jgi:site-specific DNA-methyltransferase (adenine-specific)